MRVQYVATPFLTSTSSSRNASRTDARKYDRVRAFGHERHRLRPLTTLSALYHPHLLPYDAAQPRTMQLIFVAAAAAVAVAQSYAPTNVDCPTRLLRLAGTPGQGALSLPRAPSELY